MMLVVGPNRYPSACHRRWRTRISSVGTAVLLVFLAGCGMDSGSGEPGTHTDTEPVAKPHYRIGAPYQVDGTWYYPQRDDGYDESGIASWYDPEYEGNLTANGEVFDRDSVSGAHRTLPLPSIVRVTNLENGRQIDVRINDRGPFVRGRLVDLSRRAAQLLGFVDQGLTRARVEILPERSRTAAAALEGTGTIGPNAGDSAALPPPPAATPRGPVSSGILSSIPGSAIAPETSRTARPRPGSVGNATALFARGDPSVAVPQTSVVQRVVHPTQLYVEAAAFSRSANAGNVSNALSDIGNAAIRNAVVRGRTMYQVRIGPLASVQMADQVLQRVIDRGFPGARIVVD